MIFDKLILQTSLYSSLDDDKGMQMFHSLPSFQTHLLEREVDAPAEDGTSLGNQARLVPDLLVTCFGIQIH